MRRRPPAHAPVPLDPTKPYDVYCRDFDLELEAKKLISTLGLPPVSSEELLAAIEDGLGAWRIRHQFAALEAAARIRSNVSQEVLEDTVVSLLVDHSGSMRGQRMLLAAAAVMMASDLLNGLKAKHEVLGFTTVLWNGGKSRRRWLRLGRPSYPGRLNDILHIIYCGAGERLNVHHFSAMLRPEILKENLDGEAVQWAASRLRMCAESRKYLIVVSDGAPVDDSTLTENGAEYLENHLRHVIHKIDQAGDIALSAIGIAYAVDGYYPRSVVVKSPDDLGTAVLELIEQLLCTPRANA
jgi:cobaltochelatase CobT